MLYKLIFHNVDENDLLFVPNVAKNIVKPYLMAILWGKIKNAKINAYR